MAGYGCAANVLLNEQMIFASVPGLAVGVSEHGERTFASSGGLTESSPYRIASLTKPFTAAATVLAMTERAIPLSTPAVDLLPSLTCQWRADRTITVEQLLGQVAGLVESVDTAMVAALGDGPNVLQDVAGLVVKAGSLRPPGERWSYYNGNYYLAGAVLSAITGRAYEDALNAKLLYPWHLVSTGFATPATPVSGWDGQKPLPAENYAIGRRPSGGLWSCVSDLLTFAEHLLTCTPLFEETQRRQTAPGDSISYGLGWALGPSGQMYLNGRLPGYRAAMLLVPDHGYASIGLANQSQALPKVAQLLSDMQRPLTGDDLTLDINDFAA